MSMDRISAKDWRKMNGLEEEPKPKYYSRYSHPLATTKNKKISSKLVVDNPFAKKIRNHEEDDLTIQVTNYLEELLLKRKIKVFSHVPQETFTKSWVTKNKNKAMGVRSGVPDMLIVFPHSVLFLELKRLKGGVVSQAQATWLEALSATGKVTAKVACGWDQAKEAIDAELRKQ